MATAIDVGDADDIHPKNKEEVGKRLALAALEMVYKKQIVGSGPMFEKMTIKGNEAILTFSHIDGGLLTQNKYGYINGFQIAGPDSTFVWAHAKIVGDKIVVTSDKVKAPLAVRYAWSDNPGVLNLYNRAGLPAIPFRTDQWKGLTAGQEFQSGPRF